VVDRILAFEGQGRVGEYVGGYEDWAAQSGRRKPEPGSRNPPPEVQKVRTRKLTNKERCELSELPQKIEALEAELDALQTEMNNPDFYRRPEAQIRQAAERAEAVPQELERAFERWQELEHTEQNG
jgi:ATP-binding cassette subfamily F protein uup